MRVFASALVGSVLVVALAAGNVPAQGILYELVSPNEESEGEFGSSVSCAGDVNNDGCDDVIVGAWYEDPGTSPDNAGRAYVFSGATGDTLYTLVSPNEETWGLFGESVSGVGDVNSDEYADVIVGAQREGPGSSPYDAGRAYVFSGATGDTLYTLVSPNEQLGGRFGVAVSGAGDVDNDGTPDVVVGAHWEFPGGSPWRAGRAYVFDGATGDTLYTLVSQNEESNGNFGSSASGAGDVNNDGYDDVIVGAWYEDPEPSPDDAGRAYVFSGATGGTLYTLVSPNEELNGFFGCSVSGAGDVNNDGYDDVVVGALWEDPGTSPTNAGRAYVFSGATGDTLYTLVSPNEQLTGCFGASVSGAGDVNNDGIPDVAVGAYRESPGASPDSAGRAYVFSGQTGVLLCTLVSPNEELWGAFGWSVSEAGDVDNDGYADVIVAAPWDDPGASPDSAGRAYVFAPRMILSGDLSYGELGLDWTPWPGASAYWVYGADNEAYFEPGLISPYDYRLAVLPVGTTTWSSASGVGDPGQNWTYMVLAVDASEQELCRSNRFGEHDFSTAD